MPSRTGQWSIGPHLPAWLRKPLFGDRERYGKVADVSDPEWAQWLAFYDTFYQTTQKRGFGRTVNDGGYAILKSIDLSGKRVIEIGPGALPHARFWRGKPAHYTLVDIKEDFLVSSGQILTNLGVPHDALLDHGLPSSLPDQSYDVAISFYSFEHIVDLAGYLGSIERVLKPGGIVIGGIPAEGGVAWGVGRFLTTRRFVRRHGVIDPDKLICWEHPNFAETVVRELDRRFERDTLRFWPFRLPLVDINLLVLFVFRRRS